MTQKPERLSVREQFVQEIENRILSGQLQVGDRLPPARELCAQMGVSLTTVNAGLSTLASKGFVEVVPRQGVFVADYQTQGSAEVLLSIMRYQGGSLNAQDVRNFCESRIALDPFVADLVVERAGDSDLQALGESLKALLRTESTEDVCKAVTAFFHQFYCIGGNALLAMLYHSTIPAQIGMYATFIRKNGVDLVKTSAQRAYNCLLVRDAAGARAVLVETMHYALEGDTAII